MNPLRRPLSLFALFCFLPAFAAAACAIDGPDTLSASPSGPEQTTGASVGAGGNFDPGDMTGGAGGEDSCASTNVEATVKIKPADIIFVIDNSGSMGQEIAGVEKNINVNFAQIIEQSMVDYRVIMLTAHGAHGNDVCIEAPLSTIAQGDCLKTNPAAPGINPGKFYHYDLYVGSHDSLCKILDTVDSPGAAHKDAHGLAPDGWKQWLRPDALKIIVEVSDDGVRCNHGGKPSGSFNDDDDVASGQQVALDFDKTLLDRFPQHFGTESERNYQFYSLVGLGEKDAQQPMLPHEPSDEVTTSKCATAADPGTGYQWLSRMTEALRFPLCKPAGYDVMFQAIAQGVVSGATVPCEFEMPKPKEGEVIDPSTLGVKYTPGDNSAPVTFQQVSSPSSCAPNRFYIENDVITMCPETCALLESDPDAKVDIEVGCGEVIE